jgi:hypothetical protein
MAAWPRPALLPSWKMQASRFTGTTRSHRTTNERVGERAAQTRFRQAKRKRGVLRARRLDVVRSGRVGLGYAALATKRKVSCRDVRPLGVVGTSSAQARRWAAQGVQTVELEEAP